MAVFSHTAMFLKPAGTLPKAALLSTMPLLLWCSPVFKGLHGDLGTQGS